MIEQFKRDVDEGLSSKPKRLSSKYFYDKIGDALFVKIMRMPEYYLTRSEYEIFKQQTPAIIDALKLHSNTYFELIELGAGDGTKTKELLYYLVDHKFQFDYFPVDISGNALDKLAADLEQAIPDLSVETKQGDYFEVLHSFKGNKKPKVILFLGSNIGNLTDQRAAEFIYNLGSNLQSGDQLLLGVDLIKPTGIVLPAYNDSQRITRDFNLNLLGRINRELGGNFNIEQFQHAPEYNERTGIASSALQSKINQTVTISSLEKSFAFEAGEKIHTEISRKYNDDVLEKIINGTDFSIIGELTDSKNYFADYILERG